jgi:hypothetical protein
MKIICIDFFFPSSLSVENHMNGLNDGKTFKETIEGKSFHKNKRNTWIGETSNFGIWNFPPPSLPPWIHPFPTCRLNYRLNTFWKYAAIFFWWYLYSLKDKRKYFFKKLSNEKSQNEFSQKMNNLYVKWEIVIFRLYKIIWTYKVSHFVHEIWNIKLFKINIFFFALTSKTLAAFDWKFNLSFLTFLKYFDRFCRKLDFLKFKVFFDGAQKAKTIYYKNSDG